MTSSSAFVIFCSQSAKETHSFNWAEKRMLNIQIFCFGFINHPDINFETISTDEYF